MGPVSAWRRHGAERQAVAIARLLATACGSGDTVTGTPGPVVTGTHPVPVPVGVPVPVPVPVPVSPALVSAPFLPTGETQASIVDGRVWVSMLPGTIPQGRTVTVRNATSPGAPVSAAMTRGGFDPIAIPATAGDSLIVVSHRTNGDSVAGVSVVPLRMRPSVVRVEPVNHKADVPLNIRVTVVFSQPIDWSTVPQGLQLLHDGVPVAASVSALATGTDTVTAELAPTAPLLPGTTYQLRVSSSLRDRNGSPMQADVDLSFSTAVNLFGTDSVPPQVRITSPVNGEVFSPHLLDLQVVATDDRALKEVDWLLVKGPGITSPTYVASARYFSPDGVVTEYSGVHDAVWGAGANGLAYGSYTWQAIAVDSNNNRTESAPVTITVAPPEPVQMLAVDSFSIMEFTGWYANNPWTYSPKLAVSTLPGADGVRIRGISGMKIPGVVEDAGAWCSEATVPNGSSKILFGEDHGFLEIEIDSGRRANGQEATGRLFYTDAAGRSYELELRGGIVPGVMPTTYTNGYGHWHCP